MIVYNRDFLNPNNLDENKLEKIEEFILPFDAVLKNKRLLEHQEFEFVYVSAKTEGNSYTKAEASTLIERGITANAKPIEDALMLKNLKKAFELFVLNPAPLNKKTLKEIHYTLTDGIEEKEKRGTFRTEPVAITATDYIPPAYGKEHIESEIEFILDNANRINNSFKRAIYLHNNIAYLQPFIDGNKRTSRIIQAMEMTKDNIIPLIMKEEFISEYKQGILSYYETGQYDDYIKFFEKAYKKQYQYLSNFI
jgi:Fic family protein